MKPFLNKFLNIFHFRRQTAFLAVLGAVFIFGFLIFPYHSAHAGVSAWVGEALSWIFSLIFAVLGWVLSSLIGALVSIAEYNKIITQPTIISTWGVVRDIVNMFFIFAILLIAFSTILRIHQYEAKQLLPKLVLYAILVNFSLTICGLFIDIAQVFTLTFVNAFKDGAINNFTTVTKLFDYSNLTNTDISTFTVMGGYMLSLVLLVVTLVTIGAMFLILLVRIAYLWILSILSPFAFVLPIIPGGQSYASQWWTMFSKQVITGPLLAFFIWLSLSILSQTGNIGNEILNKSSSFSTAIGSGNTTKVSGLPTTEADFLINYVIAIAMMFIGLMLTSQMGGAAGKIAGGASNWMQKSGTGLLTGRIGPTPMRWARERYGSWRGQRESIRKEKVSRFGQGASALQDWAINKNVGHALSQIYKAPAGAIGRGVGRYAKQVHRGLGGSEESLIGRGLKTTSEWRPGQKDRWRAMERVEKYKDSTLNSDIQTILKAKRVSALGDDNDVRNLEAKAGTELERAAYAIELGSRRSLGRKETDVNYTEKVRKSNKEVDAYQKDLAKEAARRESLGKPFTKEEYNKLLEDGMYEKVNRKGLISRTSNFLERAPDVKQKFDDNIKKISPDIAAKTDIYTKPDGKLNDGEIVSDALQGKIDLSAFTKELINKLDQSMPGSGKGKIFNDLAKSVHDTKEMVRIFGNINKELRSEYMDDVTLDGISSEMRTAFGEATGHWKNVFEFKERDKILPDGTTGKELYTEDGSAEKFLSRKENRALLEKSHGTSWTKDLLKFMHENWMQYEMTGSQWENILKDPGARDTIFENGSKLVDEIKGKLESYDLNTKYGYGMNRLRNTVMMSQKSDKYKNSEGKLVEAYEINSESPIIREAAQKALENQIMQNRISPERLEGVDLEIEVTDLADPAKIIKKRNDNLIKAMTKFSHGQLAKMMLESQERGEKIISYMIDNSEASKSRLKRLPNDSNTVHFLDEKYIGDRKDFLDQNFSIRQALEELGIITK